MNNDNGPRNYEVVEADEVRPPEKNRFWHLVKVLVIAGLLLIAAGYITGAIGWFDGGAVDSFVSHDGMFTEININLVSASVRLYTSNRFGYDIRGDERDIIHSIENGRLIIGNRALSARTINIGRRNQTEVIVYYPAGTHFDGVNIVTVSGGIQLEGIQSGRFSASSTSGRITADNIMSENITIFSTSGAITANDLDAQNINISSISGRITADGLNSPTRSLSTTSGRIDLNGELTGNTTVSSVSGRLDVNVAGREADYDLSISTVSGRAHVNGYRRTGRFNNNASNSINLSTVSGGVQVEFDR